MDEPPFNVFDKVLDKILNDQAHTFLLVPRWLKRKFYHRAHSLALDAMHFPKRAKLFERNGKPVGGIKWSVSVFLVCGHNPRCEKFGFHTEKGDMNLEPFITGKLKEIRSIFLTEKGVEAPSLKNREKLCTQILMVRV